MRALRGTHLGLLGDGDVRRDERSAPFRTLHPGPAVEGGNPISEPHKPASVGLGASDTVVAHAHSIRTEGGKIAAARIYEDADPPIS